MHYPKRNKQRSPLATPRLVRGPPDTTTGDTMPTGFQQSRSLEKTGQKKSPLQGARERNYHRLNLNYIMSTAYSINLVNHMFWLLWRDLIGDVNRVDFHLWSRFLQVWYTMFCIIWSGGVNWRENYSFIVTYKVRIVDQLGYVHTSTWMMISEWGPDKSYVTVKCKRNCVVFYNALFQNVIQNLIYPNL